MSGPRERVLIVDDDAAMARAVARVLAPLYRLETAPGASRAAELLAAARFHVALVDVQLKDGDGYTLCQEIKARHPETDVILMTGSVSQPDEKLYRSLEEGAFYFLFKPFERRVLLALVERCLSLQRERRAKERYARELAEDLEKARRFQLSLLPREPVRQAGWHAEGRFAPCEALGGDFYMALEDRRGGVIVAMADVVGHGVSAAMYAGMLRSMVDAARRREPDPVRVLSELLAGIEFFEGSRYATFFYAHLQPDGHLRYISAGHPPALWQSRASGLVPLGATGLPLSLNFRDRPQQVREIVLQPGERLLVYTDGAFEARDPEDRELGRDGLTTVFEALRDLPAAPALDQLLTTVRQHCGGRPLEDDVTLLLVERE